jgi:hypothetical protein
LRSDNWDEFIASSCPRLRLGRRARRQPGFHRKPARSRCDELLDGEEFDNLLQTSRNRRMSRALQHRASEPCLPGCHPHRGKFQELRSPRFQGSCITGRSRGCGVPTMRPTLGWSSSLYLVPQPLFCDRDPNHRHRRSESRLADATKNGARH